MYIESILALQNKAGGSAQLPLAIMTSGDTHARTEKLLQDHAYFGMQPGQVTLLKQEKVPPLLDLLPPSTAACRQLPCKHPGITGTPQPWELLHGSRVSFPVWAAAYYVTSSCVEGTTKL